MSLSCSELVAAVPAAADVVQVSAKWRAVYHAVRMAPLGLIDQ